MIKKYRTLFAFYTLCCTLLFSLVTLPTKTIAQSPKEVRNTGELQKAVTNAHPGDVILLADGEYQDETLSFKVNGTDENRIVIKARNKGKAILTGTVRVEGDYLSLEGISFRKKGNLEISGNNCIISRCNWSDVQTGKWIRVAPGSSRVEISYNLFENKNNNRELEKGCQLMQIVVRNENERHHIHHNLFREIPKGKTGNGFETLQLITENNPFDPPGGPSNTVIEDNLFIRCNGESEIISVKSNGNLIRRNTFRASKGSLVLRHGDNNVVTGNYFFADGEKESGGVRLQGTGQVVANNYFQDLGQLGLGMMDGTPDDLYIRVERAQILFNSFINCTKNFVIGLNHSSHPNGTAPKDCMIYGNIFYYDKESKIDNFIEYVQNDEPENWQWQNNIAFGAPVMANIPGILTANPELSFNPDKIGFPTAGTPSSTFPADAREEIKTDLFGNPWNNPRTLGAIQYPAKTESAGYLTELLVGPDAK